MVAGWYIPIEMHINVYRYNNNVIIPVTWYLEYNKMVGGGGGGRERYIMCRAVASVCACTRARRSSAT